MYWYLIILICLIPVQVHSQGLVNIDPRSEARGNTFSVESGPGSIWVNPAGNANIDAFTLLISSQNIAGFDGLINSSLGIATPTKIGAIGLIIWTTGDQLFSQSAMAVNWSQKLGIAQLGLRPSFSQSRMEGARSINTFQLDFSGLVELTPQMVIGAGITNMTKSKYSDDDPIPVVGRFGIDIIPVKVFHLTLEVEKDLLRKPEFKMGCSYLIKERLELLTGLITNPIRQTVGLGLLLKKFKAQWALVNLPGLGSKQSFSLYYQFKRKKDA